MILKSTSVLNKAENDKVVGVVLPSQIFSYLALFITAKGLTKAKPVRDQMQKWYELTRKSEPVDELLDELAHKVLIEWESVKSHIPDKSVTMFKVELRRELKKRGLHEEHIQFVLNKLE